MIAANRHATTQWMVIRRLTPYISSGTSDTTAVRTSARCTSHRERIRTERPTASPATPAAALVAVISSAMAVPYSKRTLAGLVRRPSRGSAAMITSRETPRPAPRVS